jgi:hypothetical protein
LGKGALCAVSTIYQWHRTEWWARFALPTLPGWPAKLGGSLALLLLSEEGDDLFSIVA